MIDIYQSCISHEIEKDLQTNYRVCHDYAPNENKLNIEEFPMLSDIIRDNYNNNSMAEID